jgi:AcrR family transcriptional regulator
MTIDEKSEQQGRRRRSDAIRNSEKVLQAAEEVFAERGVEAGMDEVALRAGVGKGTLYRSWPSKEELVAGLLSQRVAWFTEMTRNIERSATALETIRRVLETAIETQYTSGLFNLAALIEIRETDLLRSRVADSNAAIQELIDAGHADGSIRLDATATDVWILFNGVTGMLYRRGETDPAVWRRYAGLVADALRVPRP